MTQREMTWTQLAFTRQQKKHTVHVCVWVQILYWRRKGTGQANSILKTKENPSLTFSELWTMCLVAMGITYLRWTGLLDWYTPESISRVPIAKKNVLTPYVVSHLCHLYGIHWCRLTLLIMNRGCNLTVSPFNTFQARFKEFGDVDLSSTLKVYKAFTKVSQGPWLKRKLCLRPTIHIVLNEFVSQSIWL